MLALACSCLPSFLLPPRAHSALAPGQGEPVPWPAEQLQELCLRSLSPYLPERIKLQIYYQGKGALLSHHVYRNASAQGRLASSHEPLAAVRLPGKWLWRGPATEGRSSPSQEQRSALLFPSVLRVPISKPSPLLCHKQFPFLRVPRLPDVLETPSRACSKEQHRSAEQEQGGDPHTVNGPWPCPFQQAPRSRSEGCEDGALPAAPFCQHLPLNALRSLADLQKKVGFCLKQPISTPCNRMINTK